MKLYIRSSKDYILQEGIDLLRNMGLVCETSPNDDNAIIPLYKKSYKAKVEPYRGKLGGRPMYSFFIYADNNTEALRNNHSRLSDYAESNYDRLVELNGNDDFYWNGGRTALRKIESEFEAAFPQFSCTASANGGLKGQSVGISVLLYEN